MNNAGIVVGGPVEGVPLDDLRRQLEVNLVGQVAVTQAVMPRLRQARGRVVFVSSFEWSRCYSDDRPVQRIEVPIRASYTPSTSPAGARRSPARSEWRRLWRTVTAAIEHALTTRRPRARYVVGLGPRVQANIASLTPTRRLAIVGVPLDRQRLTPTCQPGGIGSPT